MNLPEKKIGPAPAEQEQKAYTKVLINDLALDMSIGVHQFEKEEKQRVIVSVEAIIGLNPDWQKDDINKTLNYETIVNAIKEIAGRGHIQLVETFAEYVADFCLNDPLVHSVKVTVEKPDIFKDCGSVATEILRIR